MSPAARGEGSRALARALIDCFVGADLVELRGCPVAVARAPGEKPRATPAARVWATRAAGVPNRRHEVIRLTALGAALVPLLDGSRNRESLVDESIRLATTAQLAVSRDGRLVADRADLGALLTTAVEESLTNLVRNALLID